MTALPAAVKKGSATQKIPLEGKTGRIVEVKIVSPFSQQSTGQDTETLHGGSDEIMKHAKPATTAR
jgi:hypothetical protein